jgi:hypothetical protein
MAVIRFGGGGGSSITLPVNVASGGTNSTTALGGSKAIVSNATAIIESATTSAEIGFVAGATSNIQAQINTKRSTASGKVLTDFQTSALSAVFNTTSATYVDTGLAVTVTIASTSDIVSCVYSGWGNMTSTDDACLFGYQIDAGSTITLISIAGVGSRQNMGQTFDLTGLSAGSHTIKMRLRVSTAGKQWNLQYHSVDNEVPTLSAKVFG